MSISEQQMRQHLRTAPVPGVVDTAAIIATGRRQLRTRRRRRALGAIAPAVLLSAVAGWAITDAGGSDYELAGAGLTLAAGSQGPVQVGDDRVDMGDGLQAWREGSVLSVGYPVGSSGGEGSHAWLDTSDWGSHWENNSYDIAVLDGNGAVARGTAVVGAVRGTPSRVDVSIEGVTASASIACFVQARGWCSYAVVVPVVVEDHGAMDLPAVKATF
jgi:hypothetical protein